MSFRFALFLLSALSACSAQEEALVLEEPALDIAQEAIVCAPEDEDGIGGTGCEPVARDAFDPVTME